MKIDSVELRELSVRLRFRFETSFGVEQDLRKLLVTVRSGDLEGYGEVTAGNEPGYSYETTDTAWVALERYIVPRLLGRDVATPAELLALYDKLRAQHGVGAAALRGGRCEGCHLSLNTVGLARIRAAPPDEVLRCEECRRILIRTAESGL